MMDKSELHQGQEIVFLETDGRELTGVIVGENQETRRYRVLWADGYGISEVCMDSPYILWESSDAYASPEPARG